MAYLDLDLTLTEQHRQLKSDVHKFALEVLRPAAGQTGTEGVAAGRDFLR